MKRRVGSRGFTLVETMIVLAITGGLFVVMAVALNGRQRNNEFTQAMNDARSQIARVITEVQGGFYQGQGTFKCTNSSGTVHIDAATPAESGENTDCLFLGDVMQFQQNSDVVTVFPVAGLRTATDLASSDPTVIPAAASTFKLKYGITVKSTSSGAGAIAFLSSFGSTSADNGDQQFSSYSTGLGLASAPLTTSSTLSLTSAGAAGIKICLDGGPDRYGLITVGANNGKLSVDLDIKNGAAPAACS